MLSGGAGVTGIYSRRGEQRNRSYDMVRHLRDSHNCRLALAYNTVFADLHADLDRALLQTCPAVV